MIHRNRNTQLKILLDSLEFQRKTQREKLKTRSQAQGFPESEPFSRIGMLALTAIFLAVLTVFFFGRPHISSASAGANIALPFSYNFGVSGTLDETKNMIDSSSAYWW